jgi:hypothetical protein
MIAHFQLGHLANDSENGCRQRASVDFGNYSDPQSLLAEKIIPDLVRSQAPDLVRSLAPDISWAELCSTP